MEAPARRKAEDRRKVCGLLHVALRVCQRLSHASDPQVETSVKTSVKHHKEILWIARDDQPLDPRVEARQNARFVWRCFVAFESQIVRYSVIV